MERNTNSEHLPRPNRRRLWTALLMLGVFVCGVAIGGGLTLKIIANRIQAALQDSSKPADRIARRLTRSLDLTGEQALKVKRIINQNIEELRSDNIRIRSRLLQQMEKARQEITAVLTPEQAQKLDNRLNRIQKLWMPPPTE